MSVYNALSSFEMFLQCRGYPWHASHCFRGMCEVRTILFLLAISCTVDGWIHSFPSSHSIRSLPQTHGLNWSSLVIPIFHTALTDIISFWYTYRWYLHVWLHPTSNWNPRGTATVSFLTPNGTQIIDVSNLKNYKICLFIPPAWHMVTNNRVSSVKVYVMICKKMALISL